MAVWEDRPTNNRTMPFCLEARDEDYDVYLFWPSLSSGMESSEMPFTQNGANSRVVQTSHYALQPIHPLSDHIDHYLGWDTVPSVCPTWFHFVETCGLITVCSLHSP
jgi:hypothetical protein